ncbi:MAG: DUF433 domain-containing protein [Anaerolineae bacterium]|nr:DUF433 domain-containing protein [Anaerolineae bacterium]
MQAPIIHILIDEQGTPRTINGGIKVHMLAKKYLAGEPATQLAEHYGIALADVYAALAYYHDNRAYFDAHDAEVQPLVEQSKQHTAIVQQKISQYSNDN